MDPQLYEWMKKRGGMTQAATPDLAGLMAAATDLSNGAVDDAALPDIPTDAPPEAGPRTRKPMVAQSTEQTVSGDDNDERAGFGVDVDERAALNDPRSGPGYTDMRQQFDRMDNAFLTGAGLPGHAIAANPYKTERDEMRDWLLKKKAAGDRTQMNALNADRTRAYLAATDAARERDLAIRQRQAEQDGRKAEADKLKQELDAQRLKLSQERSERDAAIRERELQVKESAEKRKSTPKPKVEVKPDEVAFGDTVFQFQGDPNTDKQLKLFGSEKMREKAAQWNTVVTGLNQLESALTRFAQHPTPENKALLTGPALSAAGATNAAIGQGAMSKDEKDAQFQALGVGAGDVSGLNNLVESAFGSPQAAQDMVKRVRQMKALAASSVAAHGQSYGYAPKAGAAQAPAKSGDMVRVRRKSDGKVVSMSAEAAAKALADKSKYEEVK